MNKLWTRLGIGLAAALLAVVVAAVIPTMSSGKRTDGLFYKASGIRPDAHLLTVDGEKVYAEDYLYWLAYDCEYLSANVDTLDWNSPLTEDMTYGAYAKADALETTKLFATIRRMARENRITLTEEDAALLEQQKADYAAYYGGPKGYRRQVTLMGIGEEAYDHINSTYFLLDHLTELAGTEGSPLYPSQAELEAFCQDNGYVTVRLLYLPSAGPEEAATAAQRLLLEDYVRQLRESSDPYALLVALAEGLGMERADEDITLGADSVEPSVLQAIAALSEDEVSDVITGEGGMYIAIRRPLDNAAAARDYFNKQLLEIRDDAKVTYNKLYDTIDAGSFYTALLEQRHALADELSAGE